VEEFPNFIKEAFMGRSIVQNLPWSFVLS